MPQIDEESSIAVKFDKKDEKIIKLLKENARESYQQIAKKSQLSRDSVVYRIKRLERLGVIDKYSINLNYSFFGLKKYYIFFQLLENNIKSLESFYTYLENNFKVSGVMLYSDKWDARIAVFTKGTEEFDEIITEINNKFSEIIIEYEIVEEVREYSNGHLIKNPKPLKINKTDKKIINLLLDNGRLSFVDISKKIRLSPDSIIYRMKKYSESGLIKKYITLTNINKQGFHSYDILLKMKTFTQEQEDSLKKLIKNNENIIGGNKTIGEWNVILKIIAKNPQEFHSTLKFIAGELKENIKDYDALLTYKELKNKIEI